MILSDVAIKKPVFAWMIMISLLLFGAISFFRLGVSQNPDVDSPVVNISVTWEGAAPEVMENEVIDPIEESIMTVEGIAPSDTELHPLQEAFRDNHGLQCGFCTPGMLTTLIEFLRDNPDPTEHEVRIAISGNLCRCTGYQGIVNAALDAAKRLQAARA